MQNDGRLCSRLIFIIILNCIILISTITFSNLAYAQEIEELHQLTKHTQSGQNAYISVGERPYALGVIQGKLYVANYLANTTSVIDLTNNMKITDIKVGGGPTAIAANSSTDRVYVANARSGTVSVINALTNTKITDIKVGSYPLGISVSGDRVYVANAFSGTVSVINALSNTKITDIKVGGSPRAVGYIPYHGLYVADNFDDIVQVLYLGVGTTIKNITVGFGPQAMGVIGDRVYVANELNDTVSVIDGDTNTVFSTIKVGSSPNAIGVNPSTNTIYVANSDSNTISVINALSNIGKKKVIYNSGSNIIVINATTNKTDKDIKVGSSPNAIGVNPSTNTIYVANSDSNTISVIDGNANRVVAGVTFNVKPANAGHIECDKDKKLIVPLSQQFYLWSGSECTAKPNQGFDFVSWQENLNRNSTQFLTLVNQPSSLIDTILDFLHLNLVQDILHLRPDSPESTLNITKFGSFTANFRVLPPPIPPEYVATLFTVVATAFVGSWLTPAVIGWRKAKKQGGRLDYYHNEIKDLYNDGNLDKKDIEELNKLTDSITDEYTRGKVNKEQCDSLGDEISISYREIFTKEIDSLNSFCEDDKVKKLSEIKSNIDDTYAKGKINEEHYIDLRKKISVFYEEILKTEIDSLNDLPEGDKVIRVDRIKDEISDAYSKEMINELHYSLLTEKLSRYEKHKT